MNIGPKSDRHLRGHPGPMFPRFALGALILAAFLVCCPLGNPPPAGRAVRATAPWAVFVPAGGGLPMSANRLANPSFESGPAGGADGWQPYGDGYGIDESGGHDGGRALRLANPSGSAEIGAWQRIVLDQPEARAIHFSAWSSAAEVTGGSDPDYSLYLDVYYTDGSPLWGQVLAFDTGTHGWQFREAFILPEQPVGEIYVYCLLRRTHAGVALFDDVAVREVQAELLSFDRSVVAEVEHPAPPYGGATLQLATADGLSVSLSSDGGAVTGLSLDGSPIQDHAHAAAAGFFVRDVAAGSDFVHVGGSLAGSKTGTRIDHAAAVPAMGLNFTATYTAEADRVRIHAGLTDTTGADRAVTLYFALPVAASGWRWGDDIRTARTISGTAEFARLQEYWDLGANGAVSPYPWAAIDGPAGGLALAIPLDSPRVARLAFHPVTNQYYVAFDLGLSPHTSRFPSGAWVDLVLYRVPLGQGFRGAAQGYFDRNPEWFSRRIPPGREGIWVAFSSLAPIPDLADFGIAVHELGGLDQVPDDEAAGIYSFRYITEPWSHWLPIDDPGVNPADYAQVVAYLQSRWGAGDERAGATLGAGFQDESGRHLFESIVEPWCNGVSGCAVFTVNPDPDIADPAYPVNKAELEWNDAARATYLTVPGLDGEYVDSYQGRADRLDQRPVHFAAADIPLTFRASDRQVGVPELFATTEFSRWLADDLHGALGKWTMANAILIDSPWGADLFDFMGVEVNWLHAGIFQPDSDALMNYRRTLSNQRPYGLLMNTDFSQFTYDHVERYFRTCLFYGVYPSMFSHNAATDRYWDQPALYERDRPLFKKYIPLIRRLNRAGWEPLTRATSPDATVFVERFGYWPGVFFTLRNISDTPATVDLSLDAQQLALPGQALYAGALLAETDLLLGPPGVTRTVRVAVPAGDVEILRPYLPGDPDANGRIDAVDLVVLGQYLAGNLEPGREPFDAPLGAADIFRDGVIDGVDLMALARLLAEGI